MEKLCIDMYQYQYLPEKSTQLGKIEEKKEQKRNRKCL